MRERLIRLAWGLGRWFAIVAAVLAFACLADWLIDRYAGSQTWRNARKSSWLFAPADPLSIGETPFWWFRVPLTAAQLALATMPRLSASRAALVPHSADRRPRR